MQGLGILFRMWIIWKIGNIILFKTNMAQKDIWHENMFHSLDCKCFYGLFTPLMTPKG